jgi:predicted lipoprotein with Yx(FWY)xxD motif
MFLIRAARMRSRKRMTSVLSVTVPALAITAVVAGCGSSSSSSAAKTQASASTSSGTKTTMHEKKKKMAEGGSMGMGNSGGHTAAAMAGMSVPHAEVTMASSAHYGSVLYDKDHFVLYMFSNDHSSKSTCYGACSAVNGGWPPLLTKGAPRVAGLNAALLGTTRRRDGSIQVTYAGHPLYYWSGDTSRTILCQHVKLHGGFWYVVNPNGTANKAKGVGTMSMM